ncbi:MAG: desulfoferrodoxin FeS4 iron-binding domain-containing protein [Dehalococcoidales bacterium]|nr:desulfoferrodoxin FeS4 iron-binding domain-containing protein [Dehalococcoidales bacterium]
MAVKEVGEVYKCNICGNVVRVVKVGGGTLVCCGRDMERIKEEPSRVANLPDSGR